MYNLQDFLLVLKNIDLKHKKKWKEVSRIKHPTDDKHVYEFDYVIQINGKKRTINNAEINLKEDNILNIAKNEKLLDKYLNNKSIKKVIFVKNRLINILVNE